MENEPQRDTKVSCIICVFNEEKQIESVLSALKDHPSIKEVIVVDDGSSDHTVDIIERHTTEHGRSDIHVVSHETNKGKSAAFATGVQRATSELLLFLDGDLVGLTGADVTALIEPVVSGRADLSLSLKQNSLRSYKAIGLDFVSGERVYAKNIILPHLDAIARLPFFAVETYINRLFVESRARISVVWWPTVTHLRKAHKYGKVRGTLGELRMTWQILRMYPLHHLIAMNYAMLKLIIS